MPKVLGRRPSNLEDLKRFKKKNSWDCSEDIATNNCRVLSFQWVYKVEGLHQENADILQAGGDYIK